MNQTVKVEILKNGAYLNARMDAFQAQAGDVVNILSGNYYERVLEMGAVKPYSPPSPSAAVANVDQSVLHEQEAPPTLPVTDVAALASVPAIDEADAVGSLMNVNGIGQKTAVKLVAAGIGSLRVFVDTDAVELSEIAGTTVAKVQSWQADARQLLEELL